MRQYKNILTILLGAWLLAVSGGCAALLEEEGTRTYRELEVSLGRATTRAVEQRTFWVLQRYGFILIREETSPTRIYFETTWLIREPFEDEAKAGAVSAETRLRLLGGPLRGTANNKQTQRPVWLVAENRVHSGQGATGMAPANSAYFTAYIQEIAAELKSEYLRDSMGL